jgi:hypothetical protein
MKPTKVFQMDGIMETMYFTTKTSRTYDSLKTKHVGQNIGPLLLNSNPQFQHVNGGNGGVKVKDWKDFNIPWRLIGIYLFILEYSISDSFTVYSYIDIFLNV